MSHPGSFYLVLSTAPYLQKKRHLTVWWIFLHIPQLPLLLTAILWQFLKYAILSIIADVRALLKINCHPSLEHTLNWLFKPPKYYSVK